MSRPPGAAQRADTTFYPAGSAGTSSEAIARMNQELGPRLLASRIVPRNVRLIWGRLPVTGSTPLCAWGGWVSNPRPRDYESPALTTELPPRQVATVLGRWCVPAAARTKTANGPPGRAVRLELREQGSNLRHAD